MMNGASTCALPQPEGFLDHCSATKKSVMPAVNMAYPGQSSSRTFSYGASEDSSSRGGGLYQKKTPAVLTAYTAAVRKFIDCRKW